MFFFVVVILAYFIAFEISLLKEKKRKERKKKEIKEKKKEKKRKKRKKRKKKKKKEKKRKKRDYFILMTSVITLTQHLAIDHIIILNIPAWSKLEKKDS